MKEEFAQFVGIKMSPELDQVLRIEAAIRGISKSDVIRQAIELWLRTNGQHAVVAPNGSKGATDANGK